MPEDRPGGAAGHKLTVLLAEDDADLSLIYSTYLLAAGHHVVLAADGEQALRQTETIDPDLVLLDLSLPVLSGEETLARLRANARTRSVPVVVFTNRELTDGEYGGLKTLGIEAVIIKVTMPPQDLAGWLQRWAQGRALPVRTTPRDDEDSDTPSTNG